MTRSTSLSDIANTARGYLQSGRIGPARRAYKEALRLAPNNGELLQEAGVVEAQAGRFRDAIAYMQKAIALTPNDHNAHANLAEVYRLSEDLNGARKHFAKAFELSPNDPYAAYALAELQVVAEEWEEADKSLEIARRYANSDPEIWNLSGILFENTNRLHEAKAAFENAVSLSANYAEALSNLASICVEVNQYREALQHYDALAKLQPLTSHQLNSLYICHSRLDMPDLALETATKLTAILPITPESLVARGSAHRALGDFTLAENDYRAALEVDPAHAPAYENLGIIHRLTEDDLAKIEGKRQQPGIESTTVSELCFALYHGYKDQKSYEDAFAALLEANAIVAQHQPADLSVMANSVDRAIEVFNREFFERTAGSGYAEEGPVFVVGMPRSGTTLTERILAAHPQVWGGGERFELAHLISQTDGYPHALANVPTNWASSNGEKIHQSMFHDAQNAAFVTDKMPANYINVGLINLVLPKAKIVYCKRNPIDNCLSCFEQHFETKQNYTYQLDTLAEAYKQHERLMQHWANVSRIDIHTLNYEDLVGDPEPHIRKLIEYVGLEWDEACLQPEKVDQSIATASVWQARQPINRKSIDRWKVYERQLQPLIQALGVTS